MEYFIGLDNTKISCTQTLGVSVAREYETSLIGKTLISYNFGLITAVIGFARKLPELIRLSFFPLGIILGHLNSLHSYLGTCYSLLASALGVVCGVFLVSGLGMDIELNNLSWCKLTDLSFVHYATVYSSIIPSQIRSEAGRKLGAAVAPPFFHRQ
ncbi:hypothetical protein LguiB_021056 [Lonicera macranthoides]